MTPHDITCVAARAECDRRTVIRRLKGDRPQPSTTVARIDRALRELGLPVPPPPPPPTRSPRTTTTT